MAYSIRGHESGWPCLFANGEWRVLAVRPETPDSRRRFATFAPENIPREQWRDMQLVPTRRVRILDQNGHGACVGHGSVSAFEAAWKIKSATDRAFSAYCVYGQVNGGSDNGAVVSDALDALRQNGVCLESTVPPGVWQRRRFPKGWEQEARRFRIRDAFAVRDFDAIGTAILLGYPVSFGVDIGRQFEPDGRGIVPDQRGGGGGHCMAAIGLARFDGRWHFCVQNSWGDDWGKGGMCYMPESYFRDTDAWAVEVTLEDPQEGNLPPKMI